MNNRVHITICLLVALVLISCKNTESDTRTASASSQMVLRTAVAQSTSEVVDYCGVVASKSADGWATNPDSKECPRWEGRFLNGIGSLYVSNPYYYQADTYDFYLVGRNSSEGISTTNGVFEVGGGKVADNDVIMASIEGVAMDGINNVQAVAEFRHLFAQVRFELTVRSVEGVTEDMGEFSLLDISQLGLRINGRVDMNNLPSDAPMTPADNATLTSARFGERYMVVPHSAEYPTPSECTIRVRVDGRDFDVAMSGNLSLNAGKCRVLTLIYDGFQVTQVKIPQWSVGEDISMGEGGDNPGINIPQWNIPSNE